MEMKIEVGRTYRRRDNFCLVRIIDKVGDTYIGKCGTWKIKYNQWGIAHKSNMDLIGEANKPDWADQPVCDDTGIGDLKTLPAKTLRDEFAMAALIGLISAPLGKLDGKTLTEHEMATTCFVLADAMLAAREGN
jgi:hypothetical protein